MRNFLLTLVLPIMLVFTGCVRDLDGNVSADIVSIEDSAMISTALIAATADKEALDLDVLILQVQTMKVLVTQNPAEVIPVLQQYANTQVEPRYRTVTSLMIAIVVRRVSPITDGNLPEPDKNSQVVAVATAVLNGIETALQLHKVNTQGENV